MSESRQDGHGTATATRTTETTGSAMPDTTDIDLSRQTWTSPATSTGSNSTTYGTGTGTGTGSMSSSASTPVLALGHRVTISRSRPGGRGGGGGGGRLDGRAVSRGTAVGLGIGTITGDTVTPAATTTATATATSRPSSASHLLDLFAFSDPIQVQALDPTVPRLALVTERDEALDLFHHTPAGTRAAKATAATAATARPANGLQDLRSDHGARQGGSLVKDRSLQPRSPAHISPRQALPPLPPTHSSSSSSRSRTNSVKRVPLPPLPDRKSSLDLPEEDARAVAEVLQRQPLQPIPPPRGPDLPPKSKGFKKFLSALKVKNGKGSIEQGPLERPMLSKRFSRSFSAKAPLDSQVRTEGPIMPQPEPESKTLTTHEPQAASPLPKKPSTPDTKPSPASSQLSELPLESQTWSPDEAMIAAYSQASIFLSQDPLVDRPKRRAVPHVEESPASLVEAGDSPVTPWTIDDLPLPAKVDPLVESQTSHATLVPPLQKSETPPATDRRGSETPARASPLTKTQSSPSTPRGSTRSKSDVYADFDKPLPNLGFVLRHGPRDLFTERPAEAPQRPIPEEPGQLGLDLGTDGGESTWPPRSASPTKRAFLSRLGGRVNEIDQAGISGRGDLNNDFAIIKQLGVGSFGTVFKAKWLVHGNYGKIISGGPGKMSKSEDDEQGVIVAIKRLDKDYPTWEKAKSQCIELKALCLIKPHLNLVRLYDAFVDPSSHALVLVFEAMQANLVDLIKSRRGHFLPAYIVGHIMCQIALGLEHIHQHNMIHRDMKPDNILYAIRDGTYHVKISDFGLTRARTGRPLTEYIGTIWYRAPENALSSRDYTAKIDCWGWGCIAMELINLSPLFPAKDTFRLLQMQTAILGSPRNWNIGSSAAPSGAAAQVIGGGPWHEGRVMAKKLGYYFQEVRPSPLEHRIQDHQLPGNFTKLVASTLKWDEAQRTGASGLVRSSLWKELGVEPRPNSRCSNVVVSTDKAGQPTPAVHYDDGLKDRLSLMNIKALPVLNF